ncbi:helix-hairpin-helix domain-containing protein [Ferdinandcohnia sp. Marseille-Q9671]
MNIRDKRIKLILLLCGISIVIFIFLYNFIVDDASSEPLLEEENLLVEPALEEEIDPIEEEKTILVDIKGGVHKEGVIEVQDGMRVKDVVDMAGGFTKDAEHRQVNLAQRVVDEMVIYVPRIGENLNPSLRDMTQNNDGKVSLNKATQEELETLTGIGPSKAAAIISYREEVGPFKALEDLLLISGIGQKSFEKIKDELTLN